MDKELGINLFSINRADEDEYYIIYNGRPILLCEDKRTAEATINRLWSKHCHNVIQNGATM